MQREKDDLDEEMTCITRNFKMFLKNNVGASTSRRQDDEDRGKESRGILRSKTKKRELKDKDPLLHVHRLWAHDA